MAPLFQNPLFIDIETVSSVGDYSTLPPKMQLFWQKKAKYLGATTEEEAAKLFFEKAAIFAEFGKVVVVAVGYCSQDAGKQTKLYVKGFANQEEKKLLLDFKAYLSQLSSKSLQLAGHNVKEFDFPYLCRRMTIHEISLPPALDTAGKKPWEVNHIDTIELWKFADRKNYTSLDLLATLFGIPSSKEAMHGAEVNDYYYNKKDLDSIKKYCIQDVIATVQVYRKLRHWPLIAPSNIHRINARPQYAQQNKLPLLNS